MPKIIIKKEDLPPISADDTGYNVRVRLISQDRNRSSFWTPLVTIASPQVTAIPYITHTINTGSGKTISVVWDDNQNNKEYDVYVKWYMTNGDPSAVWEYKGSTLSNTYTLIDPSAVPIRPRSQNQWNSHQTQDYMVQQMSIKALKK